MAIRSLSKIDLKSKKNIESLKHSIKEKSKIEKFLKKNSLKKIETNIIYSSNTYISKRKN